MTKLKFYEGGWNFIVISSEFEEGLENLIQEGFENFNLKIKKEIV